MLKNGNRYELSWFCTILHEVMLYQQVHVHVDHVLQCFHFGGGGGGGVGSCGVQI